TDGLLNINTNLGMAGPVFSGPATQAQTATISTNSRPDQALFASNLSAGQPVGVLQTATSLEGLSSLVIASAEPKTDSRDKKTLRLSAQDEAPPAAASASTLLPTHQPQRTRPASSKCPPNTSQHPQRTRPARARRHCAATQRPRPASSKRASNTGQHPQRTRPARQCHCAATRQNFLPRRPEACVDRPNHSSGEHKYPTDSWRHSPRYSSNPAGGPSARRAGGSSGFGWQHQRRMGGRQIWHLEPGS
ncbi:MAG: hypothetical protein EBY25_12200, partial [Betaproteobacteria bacterium]|nr:hypothetical protein [Betaproteobacteria bacterium]